MTEQQDLRATFDRILRFMRAERALGRTYPSAYLDLAECLSQRISLLESSVTTTEPVADQEAAPTPQTETELLLSEPVRNLGLPIRAVKAAHILGAKTVGDLTRLYEGELMVVRGFGAVSLAAVKQRLGSLGLSLASPPPPLVAAPTASQPQSPTPRVFTAG